MKTIHYYLHKILSLKKFNSLLLRFLKFGLQKILIHVFEKSSLSYNSCFCSYRRS